MKLYPETVKPSKLIRGFDNLTLTENGAVAFKSSLNKVLDMFSRSGASRGATKEVIEDMVLAAANENLELAIKALFYARDIRGGQGERDFFRTGIAVLANSEYANSISHLVPLIPEYGRWDDLYSLFGTPLENNALETIYNGLYAGDRLCAKWMDRPNKKYKDTTAKKVMDYIAGKQELAGTEITDSNDIRNPTNYRHLLVALTNVVETKMCSNQWELIDFSKLPSRALHIYKKAFSKHTPELYVEFLSKVEQGKAKINSSALYPHEIVKQFLRNHDLSSNDERTLEAQWKALPDYLNGSTSSILPVCDTSGSMAGLPQEVCLGLGIYLAEHNKGIFANHFITFSSHPTLQKLEGNRLKDKITSLDGATWNYNTDLNAVFELILDIATTNNLDESEMPTTIIVISDMEFDSACQNVTNFSQIKKDYSLAGYKMPVIVFWNVNSRTGKQPVTETTEYAMLVSGFSPSIIETVLKVQELPAPPTPIEAMLGKLDSDRYSRVTISRAAY